MSAIRNMSEKPAMLSDFTRMLIIVKHLLK